MAGAPGGSMTLVLERSALERLDDPAAALADAARWSTHIGVVGDDPEAVRTFVERVDADPDFVSGTGGASGALSAVRQRFATERHVFVSDDESALATARALGWESLPLEEAATKAEWTLEHDDGRTDGSV